jgi:hypothetical protein
MNPQAVTVEGTLQPDGTLQLDQKLNLLPGRVQVTVQPWAPSSSAKHGLVEVMDQIRASQQARGYHGRTVAEMQAEEATRQEENDDYERRYEEMTGRSSSPQT